jgi:hypothetical protein
VAVMHAPAPCTNRKERGTRRVCKSQPIIFICSAPFLRALVCLSAPSLLGRFGADTVISSGTGLVQNSGTSS